MEFRHFNRNMRGQNNFPHRGYSTYIAPGATYSHRDKNELESLFADNLMLETLKALENPLQKNLGDAYNMDRSHKHLHHEDRCTHMRLEMENMGHEEIPEPQLLPNTARLPDILPSFSSIANMISSFINNITGVITFHYSSSVKSEKNMTSDKSDLNTKPLNIDRRMDFVERDEVDASPPIDDAMWHFSSHDCAKNTLCENSGSLAQFSPCGGVAQAPTITAMSLPMLRDPADTCQVKMAKIQDLLSGKTSPKPKVRPYSRYTPKKVFIDPKFVEETMVDVFVSEPVEHLQSIDTTNFVNPGVITQSHLIPAEMLPRIRLESQHTDNLNQIEKSDMTTAFLEHHEVESDSEVKDLSSVTNSTVILDKVETQITAIKSAKAHDIDDKWGCLKKSLNIGTQAQSTLDAMEIVTKTSPQKQELVSSCEDKVTQLKVLLAEQKKNKLQSKLSIEQELTHDAKDKVKTHVEAESNFLIPDEKHSQSQFNSDSNASSLENSPKVTVIPPDSFDEIKGRFESNSSDDSFVIVFSESPNPSPPGSLRDRLPSLSSEDSFIIFEDERPSCFTVDSEESDCESNLTSVCRYTRTLADLTDESLYCDDRDCYNRKDSDDSESEDEDTVETVEEKSRGVLLTEEKKQVRVKKPEKKVRFSEAPPEVHRMYVWSYAARQARIGNWRQAAADAERFKRRIADADMAISWVLKPAHRNRVKFQRFMPWWHAQRRREEAERKAEAERKKKEEEVRLAEEKRMEEERLAEEKRLEEERIAEEKRIEEEVREEMKRESMSRKTISKEQFALNLRAYLNKKKMQRGSSPQVRIVPDVTKHKPQQKQNSDCKKSDSDIFTNIKVGCQNMANGFGEDTCCTSKTSDTNCYTGITNETGSGEIITEKILNDSCNSTNNANENDVKHNMEVTVKRFDNNDNVKRLNGLTEAVVKGISET